MADQVGLDAIRARLAADMDPVALRDQVRNGLPWWRAGASLHHRQKAAALDELKAIALRRGAHIAALLAEVERLRRNTDGNTATRENLRKERDAAWRENKRLRERVRLAHQGLVATQQTHVIARGPCECDVCTAPPEMAGEGI